MNHSHPLTESRRRSRREHMDQSPRYEVGWIVLLGYPFLVIACPMFEG